MGAQAERFNALADGAHLLLSSVRLHYNQHSTSLPQCSQNGLDQFHWNNFIEPTSVLHRAATLQSALAQAVKIIVRLGEWPRFKVLPLRVPRARLVSVGLLPLLPLGTLGGWPTL